MAKNDCNERNSEVYDLLPDSVVEIEDQGENDSLSLDETDKSSESESSDRSKQKLSLENYVSLIDKELVKVYKYFVLKAK